MASALPSAFGMMRWVTATFDAPLGKWGSEGLRAIWVARGPWSPRGWYYGAGRIAFAMRLVKASSEGVEHVREGLGEVGAELWGLDAYATLRENAGQLRESAWLLAKQESLGDSERLREALQGLDRGGACTFSYPFSYRDKRASLGCRSVARGPTAHPDPETRGPEPPA